MKKKLTLLVIMLSTFSFSQNVTVSIENLKANNVTVSSGSPIDLGNNPSINVTFRVDLEKLAPYTIGPAKVWISVFDSSGNRTDHEIVTVPENEFITGASADFDIDILDSEIDFGNGNYLSALLKQDNQPGAEWESQHIPIIKTPAFELSPSSLSLPCGDISQRTFTVTNSSNLSGVIYQWSIGNGWSGNVGNNNSITLTPNNGTVLPSNVSVTPIYNGNNQQTLTCNVTRASITPSYPITGYYETTDSLNPTYNFDMDINNFDLEQTMKTFNTVEQLAPIAKNGKGSYSTMLTVKGDLDQQMEPVMNSINGKGSLRTQNIRLEGYKPLQKVAKLIKYDQLDPMELNDVNITFSIADGKVFVEPFTNKIGETKVTIAGSNSFDQTIDYVFSFAIPRKEFGSSANKAVDGLLAQASAKGVNLDLADVINIDVGLKGPASDPKITTDFSKTKSNATDALKDKAKEELEKKKKELEEQAKKEIEKQKQELEKKKKEAEQSAKDELEKQKKKAEEEAKKAAEEAKKKAEEEAKKKLKGLFD